MKIVVILGADSMEITVTDMLNPHEMKLVGLGDTRAETWNAFSDLEKGELEGEIQGTSMASIDLAVAPQPDIIVIATTDPEKSHALQYMAIRAGFLNDIIFIRDLCQQFSATYNVLHRTCRRFTGLCIEGSATELGRYRGDTSWRFSALVSDHRPHLFGTSEGLNPRDTAKEQELVCSSTEVGQFSGAGEERLMGRMPVREQIIIKKDQFPETAFGVEDGIFVLVCTDACLYNPIFSELEFFFPHMAQGGVILLKGGRHVGYGGAAKAMEDLEARYDTLLMLPTGGLDDTPMIAHP